MTKRLITLILTALLAALLGVSFAQTVTIWSGFPEMEAFYRHVADDF